MGTHTILRIGSVKDVARFEQRLTSLGVTIPCDDEIVQGTDSPLRLPIECAGIKIGNRIAVQPMEGWDGTIEGSPSESTLRRWRRFGSSGAQLIWGGEAVAVAPAGRSNPHQLVIAALTEKVLAELRAALIEEHRLTTGSDDGLLIG